MLNEKAGRLVFNIEVANKLLQLNKGYQIINIKRSKYNPEKSVFVFEQSIAFDDDLHTILNSIK